MSKPRLEAVKELRIRIATTMKNLKLSEGWSLKKYDVEIYVMEKIICIGISDIKNAA